MYGRHVFMGYLDEEEKTKETFDEELYLMSGDIGKKDKDGFLFITGRKKGNIYKGKCKSRSKKGRMCKQRGVTERRTRKERRARYMGKKEWQKEGLDLWERN